MITVEYRHISDYMEDYSTVTGFLYTPLATGKLEN